MAESGNGGPGLRDVGHEVVVGGVWEEGRIAMAGGIVFAIFLYEVVVGRREVRVKGGHDHHGRSAGRWRTMERYAGES